MKVLFAIISCNDPRYYPEKTQVQRETWIRDIEGADYKFFFGRTDRSPLPDEVILDCLDDYESLYMKVRAILIWAYERGYDAVVKCDDDSYIFPKNLLRSGVEKYHYAGCYIPAGEIDGVSFPAFAGGGCYWLSRKAVTIVLSSPVYYFLSAEDRNIGYILAQNGIFLHDDGNHTCMTWAGGDDGNGHRMRLTKKPVVAVHTCTSQQIRGIHNGKESLKTCYTRQF